MSARIVIVSGPPGAGKSSISRKLAETSAYERAVHIHTDDFYQYIRKGYVAPWLPECGNQNAVMIESAAASAEKWADGGYEAIVDGVIGPWYIEPWINIAKKGIDVRYINLRPGQQMTIERIINRKWQNANYENAEDFRQDSDYFPLTYEVVKDLWDSLADLGEYEPHVVDTTNQTVEESVAVIRKMLAEDAFRIF